MGLAVSKQRVQAGVVRRGSGGSRSSSGSSCGSLSPGLLLLLGEEQSLLPLSLSGGGSGLLSGGLLGAQGVRDEGHDAGGENLEHLGHHRLGVLGAEAALDLGLVLGPEG